MFDVLIRGGRVIDGTGAPGFRADVGVQAGMIAAVGPDLAPTDGRLAVDAGGLVVAPGFIDLHSHSDFTFPSFPGSPGQVSQGVTSELIGHCGDTPAPVSTHPGHRQQLIDYVHGLGPDLDWRWTTFGDYLEVLDASRPAVNCFPLVGHNTLRIAAMGMSDAPPTREELAEMQSGVRQALAAGAWGMSTGLSYAPGQWASTEEIVAVGGSLGAADALYASHIRNESDELLVAVEEALAIGERLGVRVEVSHLKAAGRPNFGQTRRALTAIEAARGRGVQATCDMYPYEAGSTFLSQVFPPWVFEGGVERMLERIRSSEVRRRIAQDIRHGIPAWGNLLRAAGGWDKVLVNGTVEPEAGYARGRSIADLAAETGRDGLDVTCDLLLVDRGATTMNIFMLSLLDVREVLSSPFSGVGSDLYAVTGPAVANHPRCCGSFARLLAWSREGLLPLEEAVRKMTSLPARTIGIADRGRVAPGLVADLTVFDAATVRDQATWQDPAAPATGIEHVFIGGTRAVAAGRLVDLHLGRVLRRPAGALR